MALEWLGLGALLWLAFGDDDEPASGGGSLPGPLIPVTWVPTEPLPTGPLIPVVFGKDGPGGEEPLTPLRALAEVVYSEPTMGGIYLVREGENLTELVRRLLGVSPGHPAIVPYIRCMTLSRWNWILYGTGDADDDNSYGFQYGNVVGNIGAAFSKVHENVGAAVEAGRLPKKAVLWNRNPNTHAVRTNGRNVLGPRTYGWLYFPRVDFSASEGSMGACEPFNEAVPSLLFQALGKAPEALQP